ncbi:hypothetical protein CRE_30222 [Caenorhabditis remanei]|uniref:Uncharacterized protein n=1 Tax=Caenorhabditis remanei TaxID=31234 RepID=E3NI98_CAERE|nr:hypothetical protein CRE_30222 [Caenorhabditis remanei]
MNLVVKLLWVMFVLMMMVTPVDSVAANISLCHDVPSTWSSSISTPPIVVLREHHSADIRMTSALDDVDCWLQKNFRIVGAFTIDTKGDNETICYGISTIDVKVGQLIVVMSEGQSAQNCTPSIYGPIPNILNIKMFIDGTRNSSTRRMELAYRNPGGHLGVQFEFHRRTVISKIQKTVEHMLRLNQLSYAPLTHRHHFFTPTVYLPPATWQYQKMEEKNGETSDGEWSISWVLVLSVMPMMFFGVVVSCYIVIQPVSKCALLRIDAQLRGGLTYTDEEIDFTIQEVDSASRVNVPQPMMIHSFKTAPIFYAPGASTSSKSTTSSEDHTAVEPQPPPEVAPKTAIPLEKEPEPTVVVPSEEKSTRTMRLPVAPPPTSPPPPPPSGHQNLNQNVTTTTSTAGTTETLSLRTGRD